MLNELNLAWIGFDVEGTEEFIETVIIGQPREIKQYFLIVIFKLLY